MPDKSFEPLPIYCTIRPSWIHGLGLFATREIRKDTELGICLLYTSPSPRD